ncbi:hypothetical protein ACWCPF_05495 [Streptomyces sp. NPDC001858]
MTQQRPKQPVPSKTARPRISPEITKTECRQCGADVHGLNGRYACGLCGWVNHWSEGYGNLPTAEDDPDHPGR